MLKKILLLVCMAVLPTGLAAAAGKKTPEPSVQRKDGGPTYNDAGLARVVEAKIASMPSLKNAGIKAESKDANITLTGEVASYGLKGVATRAAKKVEGVKSVKNNITVAKGAPLPGKHKAAMKSGTTDSDK